MPDTTLQIPLLAKYCNEALILAVIAEGDKHGYQLAIEIEERSNGFFKFNHGTLYPILHKLEKEELIAGSWHAEGPKRKRKYYLLTEKGQLYLDNQRKEWGFFFDQFFSIIGSE